MLHSSGAGQDEIVLNLIQQGADKASGLREALKELLG